MHLFNDVYHNYEIFGGRKEGSEEEEGKEGRKEKDPFGCVIRGETAHMLEKIKKDS